MALSDYPTRDDAWRFQRKAHVAGDLLVWTIYEKPKDFPGVFVARPYSSRAGAPCDFVMVAATLEAVRDLLPPGLCRMPRQPGDDPVIVETWI